MNRMNLRGKGQALDGDRTTSGAVCIASLANYKIQGRPALRVGDATTPCPACNQRGTVVEGVPGFYIVPRCMAYEEVLNELGAPQANLPRSLIERLNPTYQQGFKAGEIFVIGDGLSRPSITAEERHAMSAAQQARDALAQLTPEEAEYMMQNLAEIAGLLSDVSLALGVRPLGVALRCIDHRGSSIGRKPRWHVRRRRNG